MALDVLKLNRIRFCIHSGYCTYTVYILQIFDKYVARVISFFKTGFVIIIKVLGSSKKII